MRLQDESKMLDDAIESVNMYKNGVKSCQYCVKKDVCFIYLNVKHIVESINSQKTVFVADAIANGCSMFVPIFNKVVER